MWSLMIAASTAHAAVPAEELKARLDEIAELRALRLDQGAPPLDPKVYERAAEGRIVTGLEAVEGHKAKKAWGVGVFDVPISRYWAAINDDKKKMEYTKLAYAEVIEGDYCAAPRRVFQFIEVPFVTDRWWTIDISANTKLHTASGGRLREQHWQTDGVFETPTDSTKAWADKGMHIASTQGAWLLVDLDGKHTLVEYYTWADPGGSVPAGLASSLAANGVDNTLEVMAQLAKDGGHCTPVP